MNDTPDTRTRLRIDFVSDVVCPWCAIGLASLEQALARVRDEVVAEIHFHPFELNPQLPPKGEEIGEHLQNKYGLSAEQLAENQARIRRRGAELGVVFGERARIYNTFDAHRLLQWAGLEGRQSELKHALLRAYFTDGQDVSDREVLVRIAGKAGLDAGRAREILASAEYATEVRAEEEFFQRAGIRGVPAIIIDRKHLISGGQPVDVFERALRDIGGKRSGSAAA
jgi:predicted DsbA family dithiol-disulfide isomerase